MSSRGGVQTLADHKPGRDSRRALFLLGLFNLAYSQISETTIPDRIGSPRTFPLGFIYFFYIIWWGAIGALISEVYEPKCPKVLSTEQSPRINAITEFSRKTALCYNNFRKRPWVAKVGSFL